MLALAWSRSGPRGVACSALASRSASSSSCRIRRRPLVVGLADIGEADLAGRAVQKPRAEPVFQRLDMARHHRDGHVQPPRRGRETAALDDAPEHRQARQSIHCQPRPEDPSMLP